MNNQIDGNLLEKIRIDYKTKMNEYKLMLDALFDIAKGLPMPKDRAVKTLKEIGAIDND